MQNIKTGIVVALLLAVCYGAFKALNEPDDKIPEELAEWVSKESDLDDLIDDVQMGSPSSGLSEADLGSIPNIALPEAATPNQPTSKEWGSDVSVPTPSRLESNPNSHTLGGSSAPSTATPLPLGAAADGPAVQLPTATSAAEPTKSDASDSLVPDSFPVIPVTTTETKPVTPPTTLVADSKTPSFPAIPVPGATNTTKPDAASSAPAGSLALPLLGESNATSSAATTKPASTTPGTEEAPVLEAFSIAREQALKNAADGKLKEALVSLTRYYGRPDITYEENRDLLEILDALAREVIFSKRHLLEAPYVATATDTVATVAAQHNITPELLRNINQLGDSAVLTQGQQVKVLKGPFRGDVNLTVGEITLFLGDIYACRMPISIGSDPEPKTGSFEVADKRRDRTYYGAGNKVINATDPSNPYGGYWIDLGQGNCLHGTPEMNSNDLKSAGCISLSPIDAADAYIMLTQGSQVKIRK